jgi:cytochrome c
MTVRGIVSSCCLCLVPAVAMAAADPAAQARGENVYERCIACHAIDRNRTGPQHCGLFGRKAGSAPGFASYSDAMRSAGIVWNAEALDRFLRNPAAMVPGTTMGYAGIADARDRADLIAWLREASRAGEGCRVSGSTGP